jgi:hypothetical protein
MGVPCCRASEITTAGALDVLPGLATIDEHFTASGQIKLGRKIDDRTLATARVTDKRERLTGLRMNVDVTQYILALRIMKINVTKFHLAANPPR